VPRQRGERNNRARGYYGSIYLVAKMSEWEPNNSSGDILIEHPKDVATNKAGEDPNGYFEQSISTNVATNESLRKLDDAMEVILKCRIPDRSNKRRIRQEWAPGPVEWDEAGNPKPNPVMAKAKGHANERISLKSRLPYR
jgi:hypothetical protein